MTISRLDCGEKKYIPCDTLVTALGLIPERELVQKLGEPVCFAGDGLLSYGEQLKEALGEAFRLPAHGNTLYMAGAAAQLACAKYAEGEFADVAGLTPVYLRLSEAEEKRLEAEKNAAK